MSDPTEEKLVLPGDLLGTAEEYVPGRGTYEYNGQVYAALMGHPKVDTQNRTVTVAALHEIPHLSEGERVYARIGEIKSAMLITNVLSSAKSGRGVPGTPEGTVHISKAKDSYVEELIREFSVGDLIKAEVLQGYPVVKLSTQAPDLGVISARCGDCNGLLALLDRSTLICSRCGRKEHRKVSSEYGGRTPSPEPEGAPPAGDEPPSRPPAHHDRGHGASSHAHSRSSSHEGHPRAREPDQPEGDAPPPAGGPATEPPLPEEPPSDASD